MAMRPYNPDPPLSTDWGEQLNLDLYCECDPEMSGQQSLIVFQGRLSTCEINEGFWIRWGELLFCGAE
jgi:hypothetical protein